MRQFRKNNVEPGRPQMTIWRMHIACWIPKAINTLRICNTFLFFHCNDRSKNATQCHVIRTFRVLSQTCPASSSTP